MKIGLRGGHSPNCKGAIGILDEQAEVRKIYNALVPMLQKAGHTIIDCNSNSDNVNGELTEGTNKANENACDMYITIHMNASSGGIGNGTECWLYNGDNDVMNTIADRINSNFAAEGYGNRGRKYSTGLHDLCASSMPAMIIETMFCDNTHDTELYKKIGANGIAEMIASGIAGRAVPKKAENKPAQIAGTAKNNVGLYYQAHVEDYGWLDAVHDGQVAGTTGRNKRLEAIRIDTRKLKNVKLKVIAHIQDIGDVDYGYIDHNTIIGTVGKGKRLEAIHIISEGLDKKKIYIQAHYANDGWGKTVQGNAGSYGLAKAMQAIKIWIK